MCVGHDTLTPGLAVTQWRVLAGPPIVDQEVVFSWTHMVDHADGGREEAPCSRVDLVFTSRGIGGGWEAAFTHLIDTPG